MKQILYDMGIFGSIRTGGSRAEGWVGGVIIEKKFYCFISCFGPFAAFLFFTLRAKLFPSLSIMTREEQDNSISIRKLVMELDLSCTSTCTRESLWSP